LLQPEKNEGRLQAKEFKYYIKLDLLKKFNTLIIKQLREIT